MDNKHDGLNDPSAAICCANVCPCNMYIILYKQNTQVICVYLGSIVPYLPKRDQPCIRAANCSCTDPALHSDIRHLHLPIHTPYRGTPPLKGPHDPLKTTARTFCGLGGRRSSCRLQNTALDTCERLPLSAIGREPTTKTSAQCAIWRKKVETDERRGRLAGNPPLSRDFH